MANFTVKDAISIHGTDPQHLFEKIVRTRIHDSIFWKERCFGLNASGILELASELTYVGGCYGGAEKPSEFICIALKMLQIQPDKDIIYEFINQDDFKYVRILGAFYLRLVGKHTEIYSQLEPLYNDYRKIRIRNSDSSFSLSYVDEFIDELLTKDRICNTTFPRITSRYILENRGDLSPRISALQLDDDPSILYYSRQGIQHTQRDNVLDDKGFDEVANFKDYRLKKISLANVNQNNYDTSSTDKINAGFVGLVRNSDLDGIVSTIRQIDDRFNRNYNYPIILLNNQEFTKEFKETVSRITRSKVLFGHVNGDAWSYPRWINQTKVRTERITKKYAYAHSESYRFMCRYMSGYIFNHPLVRDLDYYWRIEPNIQFYCDIDYDPFVYMKKNNKVYGWVISMTESQETIRTLWKTTKMFLSRHPEYLNPQSNVRWILDNKGNYNGCHFWSNFEIVDLRFYRSKEYLRYFNFLDRSGGFFYERWGDAPVHSIAASLFLNSDQLHFFSDIGYHHSPIGYCPDKSDTNLRCACGNKKNLAHYLPCFRNWKRLHDTID
ncbi:hypothetical protein BB561_001567 [Smittium simulii]|uniref:Pre-mRNA-splicing factor 38 n=1 Tax=Smittium simulii TaxID=133385 RepID=A0A2T9YU35_9FUNG|nr:hypothetical protein BB561_001567 [Smittium simulii]